MHACVFCAIVTGDVPAHRVYEDAATVAFMDINPATDGHALVVPRAHAADIWDLEEEDGVAVWRAVQRVAGAVRSALRPDGLNLLQANGRAAFQSVFHFHVHVVPRYVDDSVHLPWVRSPGDHDRLGDLAARLRSALS
jgi:histidine triad (HIT) family protein